MAGPIPLTRRSRSSMDRNGSARRAESIRPHQRWSEAGQCFEDRHRRGVGIDGKIRPGDDRITDRRAGLREEP